MNSLEPLKCKSQTPLLTINVPDFIFHTKNRQQACCRLDDILALPILLEHSFEVELFCIFVELVELFFMYQLYFGRSKLENCQAKN